MILELAEPDDWDNLSNEQVLNNIDIISREIDFFNSKKHISPGFPVYRTIREFSLEQFFVLFGLKRTAVFRLTQSVHAEKLPRVIVIHCNGLTYNDDKTPQIIGGKLFISQQYFKDWVARGNDDGFETDLMQMFLKELSIYSSYEN